MIDPILRILIKVPAMVYADKIIRPGGVRRYQRCWITSPRRVWEGEVGRLEMEDSGAAATGVISATRKIYATRGRR